MGGVPRPHRQQIAPSIVAKGGNLSIVPRRKQGQECGGSQPIEITRDILQMYFHLPLKKASQELVGDSISFMYF
jgi:hypothetical protein